MVVPFCGSYLESYKAIPKRNYYGALGIVSSWLEKDDHAANLGGAPPVLLLWEATRRGLLSGTREVPKVAYSYV